MGGRGGRIGPEGRGDKNVNAGGAPLYEQIAIFALAPPIGACLWRLMSRGWAMGVQGGKVSDRTKRRQGIEFWALLAVAYALMLGVLVVHKLR